MKLPRNYFHEPPDWLWWLVVRYRWVGALVFRSLDRMPGTCPASTTEYISNPAPGFKPCSVSAAGCLRDVAREGACWCGKYTSLDQLEEDLRHPLHIRDPWHGITVEFVD